MQNRYAVLPFLVLAASANAQDVLFAETFEGAQHGFTLNTTDVNSVASGDNTWLVNNAYTGGSSTLTCMGFPFSFNVPNTPAQPPALAQPNGRYLHIASTAAIASGILNCNFAAADGLCTGSANHFARMTADVSTTGAADVAFSFWWLCAGSSNNYGEVYYSVDGGLSWTLAGTPPSSYWNQGTWVQQTISLPAFAGQAALRFGFRFVNGTSTSASDPAFGIDDVAITAAQVGNVLTAEALAQATICRKTNFDVAYTASGAWNAGNLFLAQLSDIDGSFAQPVGIGAANATASGIIHAQVPAGIAAGTGYRIRVVSTDPQVDGTPSPTVVTVTAEPHAGENTDLTVCANAQPVQLFDALDGSPQAGGIWSFSGAATVPVFNPATSPVGCYMYVVTAPGCAPDTAQVCVALDPCLGVGRAASSAQPGLRWLGQQGAQHLLALSGGRPADAVRVTDAAGRSIAVDFQVMGGDVFLHMADVPSGIYIVRVACGQAAWLARLVHCR